tara:strand:+ start:328 stop:534 length:207 start_codon:yes stop_codon:yes gene_type:complete
MMNINTLEKEILKAVNIERQGLHNNFRNWETIEESFIDLEKFVCKLFTEYKEDDEWDMLEEVDDDRKN